MAGGSNSSRYPSGEWPSVQSEVWRYTQRAELTLDDKMVDYDSVPRWLTSLTAPKNSSPSRDQYGPRAWIFAIPLQYTPGDVSEAFGEPRHTLCPIRGGLRLSAHR